MGFIGKIAKGDVTIDDNKVTNHGTGDWAQEFNQQNKTQVVIL